MPIELLLMYVCRLVANCRGCVNSVDTPQRLLVIRLLSTILIYYASVLRERPALSLVNSWR